MQRNFTLRFDRFVLPVLLGLAGFSLLLLAFGAGRIGLRSPGAVFGTNQLFLAISGLALVLAASLPLLAGRVRQVAEWLLLITGAVAAVNAGDLFLVSSIAGPRYKAVLLGSVLAAFVLMRVAAEQAEGISFWKAAREIGRAELERLPAALSLIVQLGLLVLAVRAFRIENQVFYGSFILIAFYGFVFHYLLHPQHRLAFYLFLSIATFTGVLGFASAFWLIAVVLLMVGLLHLPIPFKARIGLTLAAGILLAVSRAGVLATVPPVIWPILGSILMFRLIIYAYDLSHARKPVNLWRSLSYFFLLPNVMFPFFPVVDHGAFVRTYFNEEDRRIYQTGISWIFRGVVHLVAYRFVYYYLVIPPTDVQGSFDLLRLAFTSFMLYFQVSGQFHLIVGLLHLFGFNLPPTNDNYLLSKNFTDLWRRANIYWKDLMTKLFYYPAHTWVTRRGIKGTAALVLTTVYVFFMTWFLHAYYWFWIRGTFLLTATDIVFWILLASFVMFNILLEARRGRTRSLTKKRLSAREIVLAGLSNTLTISLLTMIWTLWTSPSLGAWAEIWAVGLRPENLPSLVLGYGAAALFFILLNWIYRGWLDIETPKTAPKPFYRTALATAGLIAVFSLAGSPAVHARVGGQPGAVLADLTTSRLNDVDADLLLQGYYDNLLSISQFNTELWEVYSKRPTDWPTLQETAAADLSQSFRFIELYPNVRITFHGAPFSTNSFGFRDQEYDLVPPPGTLRSVILGPSFVMGSGAADADVFEAVLERRLNETFAGGRVSAYEFLNFGVAGYSALEELYDYETRALDFQPDAVFYFSHQLEETVAVRNLANAFVSDFEIPYPYLVELGVRAGVSAGQSQAQVERLLSPFGEELLAWTYTRLAEKSRQAGVLPIWIYLPALEIPETPENRQRFMGLAEQAGFTTFDLSAVYAGQDIPAITVAEWDLHPNAAGHRLIAQALFDMLRADPTTADLFDLSR